MYALFISGCIIMSLLVNVSSFTNKVLVRKGTSSPSTTAACRHNANAKMDFTCILTENATSSTPEVRKQLYYNVTIMVRLGLLPLKHNKRIAKMDFTCILTKNTTSWTQEVRNQLFSKVTLVLDCQGGYAIRKVNVMM